jgi:CheY-like chemotaxis protein
LTAFTILIADDDAEDCLLLAEAVREAGLAHRICTVPDGEALLDYLGGCDRYQTAQPSPRPDLILLDLNMPRRDGREALRLLKQDQRLRRIPVVVLTTSTAPTDIAMAYEAGASSYLSKPATFQGWIELVGLLDQYWFGLVELPRWE